MLYAILGVLSFALQNICCKEYGRRYPGTLYAQSVMIFVSAAIVAAIMAALGGAAPLSFKGNLLALAFGALFVLTLATMTLAMNSGHMGITLLIQNSSLIIPTVVGLTAWHEQLTLFKGAGIVLIFALLALSAGDTTASPDAQKMTPAQRRRWLTLTALAFLGDGLLSVLQGMMSRESASTTSINFTFWTSVYSAAVCAVLIAVCRVRGGENRFLKGRRDLPAFLGSLAGIGVGTAGGNCFSILALTQLPSLVVFPIRQGGLVLLMWGAGILFYHERVNRRGLLMLAVGLAGLVLVNLS